MSILQNTGYRFDLAPIREEVKFYLEKYPRPQLGLTRSAEAFTTEERLNESTGLTSTGLTSTGSKKRDADFIIFNKDFNGTALHRMFNTLSENYKLCRFRIMSMHPSSAYTAHTDLTPRLHYAVETNKDCIFLFPKIKQQLFIPQDGNVYQVDTRQRHTFVNAGTTTRIHLLLSLLP